MYVMKWNEVDIIRLWFTALPPPTFAFPPPTFSLIFFIRVLHSESGEAIGSSAHVAQAACLERQCGESKH